MQIMKIQQKIKKKNFFTEVAKDAKVFRRRKKFSGQIYSKAKYNDLFLKLKIIKTEV